MSDITERTLDGHKIVRVEVSILQKQVHDRPFTMQWISKRTTDWVIANVKISDTVACRRGIKSVRLMITFDVNILEQSETT
jgi:hypothetical protein